MPRNGMKNRSEGRTQPGKPDRSGPKFGNHNRAWIWGRNVVLETLRQGTWIPESLVISDRCGDAAREIQSLAAKRGIDCQSESDTRLTQLCRSDDHQGVAARMPAFPYAPLPNWLSSTAHDIKLDVATAPWVLLDRIQDAFNFGAIVRSASALGFAGVIVAMRSQSPVNSQVARSSAGAVNHVPIVPVDDLVIAVECFQAAGGTAIAMTEKAQKKLDEVPTSGPRMIVLGNEGEGITAALRAACHAEARIPISGRVGSLNVAVAAGVAMYALGRQAFAGKNG
jgi:23S rRNA (guanosine2251-2'-O)-methyltransferase